MGRVVWFKGSPGGLTEVGVLAVRGGRPVAGGDMPTSSTATRTRTSPVRASTAPLLEHPCSSREVRPGLADAGTLAISQTLDLVLGADGLELSH